VCSITYATRNRCRIRIIGELSVSGDGKKGWRAERTREREREREREVVEFVLSVFV